MEVYRNRELIQIASVAYEIIQKQSTLVKANKKYANSMLDNYGVQKQTTIWIEELSELVKVICKWQREYEKLEGDCSNDLLNDFITETADVENVLEQIKLHFNIYKKVQTERIIKNKRQLERIANE